MTAAGRTSGHLVSSCYRVTVIHGHLDDITVNTCPGNAGPSSVGWPALCRLARIDSVPPRRFTARLLCLSAAVLIPARSGTSRRRRASTTSSRTCRPQQQAQLADCSVQAAWRTDGLGGQVEESGSWTCFEEDTDRGWSDWLGSGGIIPATRLRDDNKIWTNCIDNHTKPVYKNVFHSVNFDLWL